MRDFRQRSASAVNALEVNDRDVRGIGIVDVAFPTELERLHRRLRGARFNFVRFFAMSSAPPRSGARRRALRARLACAAARQWRRLVGKFRSAAFAQGHTDGD